MRLTGITLGAAAAVIATGVASGQTADEAPGRFQMTPVEGGVLRLDTASGALSFCRPQDEDWGCALVPEAHSALQKERDALRRRNAALRAEIEALKKAHADSDAEPETKKQDRIPSETRRRIVDDETIDEMMSVLETMVRRFKDMLESLREPSAPKQL